MKVLGLVALGFIALCWLMAIAADLIIGRVEKKGHDGL